MNNSIKQKGFLLILSLLIIAILSFIGLTFATLATRDLHFAEHEGNKIKSYYMAKAGIEYYKTFGMKEPKIVYSFPDRTNHIFELEAKKGYLYSTGIIKDVGGNRTYTETIKIPLLYEGE